MKHFFLSCTLFCLQFLSAGAQNLVPNPGFEELDGRPRTNFTSIMLCKGWYPAYRSGTDYFHVVNGTVPSNDLGRQEPHSGKAYAGICLHWNYLEYLQTTLNEQLKEGQQYLIEFYISRAEKSLNSVDELGVLFTDERKRIIPDHGLPEEPSVKFKGKSAFRSKDEWMKVSALYEAEGWERHLILGLFDGDTTKSTSGFSHYYVDDVSITPVTAEAEETEQDTVQETAAEEKDPAQFDPPKGEALVLRNVFFRTNESALLPESHNELDRLADYLENEGGSRITILGHTDNTGNEQQNKKLSEARAAAVAAYLRSRGIAAGRISHAGYGGSKPVADNVTETGRQLNRRVEFLIEQSP